MLDTLRLYFMGGGTLPHPPLGDGGPAVPDQEVGQSALAFVFARTLACACACMCACVPYASAVVGSGGYAKSPACAGLYLNVV